MRNTKTEYVSCPSCGRTLFDLQEVTEQIRQQTGHLPGVSIAVMGCIVNGPGEMADADFGCDPSNFEPFRTCLAGFLGAAALTRPSALSMYPVGTVTTDSSSIMGRDSPGLALQVSVGKNLLCRLSVNCQHISLPEYALSSIYARNCHDTCLSAGMLVGPRVR